MTSDAEWFEPPSVLETLAEIEKEYGDVIYYSLVRLLRGGAVLKIFLFLRSETDFMMKKLKLYHTYQTINRH
jgi:hypothetical protein